MKALLKNKTLRTLVKFAFVIGLLVFLGKKGFLSVEETRKALSRYDLVLPALLMMMLGTSLSIVRWFYLVSAQGIHLQFGRTFMLCCVGFFFNIALPGVVSGDVIKAIYVAREIKGKRARAFSSIIFDRVVGLSGLILVAASALGASFFLSPLEGKALRAVQLLVAASGTSIVLFFAYLFLVKENWDPLLKVFQKLEDRYPFLGSFTRTYEGIRVYHENRKTVLAALAISCVIHLLSITSCVIFARAMGLSIPTLSMFIVIPIGMIVTAIPVTPAGVGTGHAAFLALFAMLGSQRGADIFNFWLLYKIIEGSIGGIAYLRFRSDDTIQEMVSGGESENHSPSRA